MNRSDFLREEHWQGSYYELCLQLGPHGDDAHVLRVLQSMWALPQLRGPWRERGDYGAKPGQKIVSLPEGPLYGSLSFPGGIELGCMTFLVRVDDEYDWLDLSLPVGMLESTFPVTYPLDRATNRWLTDVERALADFGTAIYTNAGFLLGIIGEEASGAHSAENLTAKDCERGGLLVPELLWQRLAPERAGVLMQSGLMYAPSVGPEITYVAD